MISKRGQVTLFIIIAIVLLMVILFVFYPRIKAYFVPTTPASSLENCMQPSISEALGKVSSQGGSINPSLYLLYKDVKIEYLCYTNQYFKTCVMQQPMLKQHIEREVGSYIGNAAKGCIDSLKTEMEAQGYTVDAAYKGVNVELAPGSVNVNVNVKFTATKEGVETYDKFTVKKTSRLYDLVMLTTSILNFEARYGDTESMMYMLYYPNIRVEKLKQEDGSKIYTLTNTVTNEKFTFATRSLSWPGGYKL